MQPFHITQTYLNHIHIPILVWAESLHAVGFRAHIFWREAGAGAEGGRGVAARAEHCYFGVGVGGVAG